MKPFRIIVDVASVLAFALIGRASHAEALTFEGVSRTFMPFLAALLLTWVVLTLRKPALTPLQQGAVVAGATLVLGMTFRLLIGDGVAWPFIVVAAIFLFTTMIGWRVLYAVAKRQSSTRSKAAGGKGDPRRSGNPAKRGQAGKRP